jgi:hypothetical protein
MEYDAANRRFSSRMHRSPIFMLVITFSDPGTRRP